MSKTPKSWHPLLNASDVCPGGNTGRVNVAAGIRPASLRASTASIDCNADEPMDSLDCDILADDCTEWLRATEVFVLSPPLANTNSLRLVKDLSDGHHQRACAEQHAESVLFGKVRRTEPFWQKAEEIGSLYITTKSLTVLPSNLFWKAEDDVVNSRSVEEGQCGRNCRYRAFPLRRY